MKIRNGFVSNSSSSSFILELLGKKNEECPTCGRKNSDFISLIERSNNDDHEGTSMYHYSAEEILEEIDVEIAEYQDRIDVLKLDDLKRIIRYNAWNGEPYTVAADLQYEQDRLKEWKMLRKQILAAKGRVIQCNISYHDELANDMIQSMVKAGTIKIIEGETD